MTAIDLLSSLINDAERNGKPEVSAALKLLRDPVAALEVERDALKESMETLLEELGEERSRLDWLEDGGGVHLDTHGFYAGKSGSTCRSGRTVRDAIDAAKGSE